MADLIVPSFCPDLAQFTDAFADRVDQEAGLLILYGPEPFQVGERITFQVVLLGEEDEENGEPALVGSGNVQECWDANEGEEERDASSRFDVFLDQLEFDARSEVMMERLFLHRISLAEGQLGTGEVALPEGVSEAHDESDLDQAMDVAVGDDVGGFDAAEAAPEATFAEEEEEAPAAVDLEPMESGEFGDSLDDIAISAADDADVEADVDFGDDEATAYEIPREEAPEAVGFNPDAADASSAVTSDDGGWQDEPEAAQAPVEAGPAHVEGADLNTADMGGYDPAGSEEAVEEIAAMHTVIDASAMEGEGDDLQAAPVHDGGYAGLESRDERPRVGGANKGALQRMIEPGRVSLAMAMNSTGI